MLFTEFRFLLLLTGALLVYWSLRSNGLRKGWLVLCSYAFYAAWKWHFLGLILFSTLLDYAVARMIQRSTSRLGRRMWLGLSLLGNLGMLGAFKYYGFFASSAQEFLGWLGLSASLPTLQVLLPVGISFYTFQTLSYTIDVYRERMPAQKSLLDIALFVSFFPQLVAGPIVRAADFLPQLGAARSFRNVHLNAALVLFVVGFVKKACVSDSLAPAVDALFADPGQFSQVAAVLGAVGYAVQIYCDFSGYSDMAIATAAFFGYGLCLNFSFPYFSTNITDFWRRWHISLSSWLRDYVYISLGGNRASEWKTHRNLLLTMLLGGLWHGAAWNFVLWGGVHGVALSVHRLWQRLASPGSSVAGQLAGWLSTLAFVVAALVLFRAGDLGTAAAVFRSMAGVGGGGAESLVPSTGVLVAGFFAAHFAAYRLRSLAFLDTSPRWSVAVGCGVVLAVAYALSPIEHVPFIYFQF